MANRSSVTTHGWGMAQGSENSTGMIIKRDPASPLKEYTVDSRMLEMYFALDDGKTVGTLAEELRLPARDVLKTIERLRAQNLVISVTEPLSRSPQQLHRSSSGTQPAPQRSKPKTPAAHKTGQETGTTKSKAVPDSGTSNKPGTSRSPESPKSARASADPAPELTKPSSGASACKAGESGTEPSFPDKGGSTRAGNFFDIGRSATSTGPGSPSSNYPPSRPQAPGPDERPGTPREDASPEAAQAIDLFEQGLSALQHKDYEEALRLFELSIELNPENRVCRANLQRVKKILAPEGPSAFG